jgi:hypothetical protein
MEPASLPTEVILADSQQTLANVHLNWTPQPGTYLELEGKTYTILERRHRYILKFGRYSLYKIALYVQTASDCEERSFIEGRWVLGDVTCTYNAQSEIIRCAVNPSGPCGTLSTSQSPPCQFYERCNPYL